MNRSKRSGYRYVLSGIVTAAVLGGAAAPALAQAPAGMGMGGGAMPKPGCCSEMMGKMPGGAMAKGQAMPMASGTNKTLAMPGFPGDAHIYHVGATGFFLDHSDTITLDPTQSATLSRIKERAMADKSDTQQKIDQAEQRLWQLTASDRPDSGQIEEKVRELEKLSGDQRIAFIRAVGTAAAVLTLGQRAALLGRAGSDTQPMTPAPTAAPAPMNGMAASPSGQDPGAMSGMGNDSMGGKPMSTMGREKMKAMKKSKKMPMPMEHNMPMGDGHM